MDREIQKILINLNRAIIQLRGVYSEWSRKHGISYNEMLVFYTIRDCGYCTQKQICDSYIIPRQTINHVITSMRENGLLTINKEKSIGKEKAFVLTKEGEEYAAPLLASLNDIETKSVEMMGQESIHNMTRELVDYRNILSTIMEEMQ